MDKPVSLVKGTKKKMNLGKLWPLKKVGESQQGESWRQAPQTISTHISDELLNHASREQTQSSSAKDKKYKMRVKLLLKK